MLTGTRVRGVKSIVITRKLRQGIAHTVPPRQDQGVINLQLR
jgi:hypothetical protein